MEDKSPYQHQDRAQACFKDTNKRKQVTRQLHPIEYFDLVPPDKELESSSSDSKDDYKQIFFIKGKKKIPKEAEKDRDHSVIKDLIINEKEPILKTDNQNTWEFKKAKDFLSRRISERKTLLTATPNFEEFSLKEEDFCCFFSSLQIKIVNIIFQRFKETVITP